MGLNPSHTIASMSEKECSGCFNEHKERVGENCRRLKAPLAEGPAYFVVCGCCGRIRTWARPGHLVRKGSPQVLSQENGAGRAGRGGEWYWLWGSQQEMAVYGDGANEKTL